MRQWNKYVETREGPVKTEAQIGMMRPQSKEPQEPPGAGRGQEEFSLKAFRESKTLLTSCFWSSGLQNCEKKKKAWVFKPPNLWYAVTEELGN